MSNNSPFTPSTGRIYFMRLPEVIQRCGLSRAHIYNLISQDQFPKQIRISEKAVAWNSQEIDDWIIDRVNRSANGL